jgi:hypothetical protein
MVDVVSGTFKWIEGGGGDGDDDDDDEEAGAAGNVAGGDGVGPGGQPAKSPTDAMKTISVFVFSFVHVFCTFFFLFYMSDPIMKNLHIKITPFHCNFSFCCSLP